jgi:hypothetical protein
MRVIKAPPSDLFTLLIDLGPRCLVLLEGETDFHAFSEWFLELEADLLFHAPGSGVEGVKAYLNEALAASTTKRVYGIIDRDFCSDMEVENCLNDPASHLFILRRYALENYLLEPDAIREELRVFYGRTFVVPDANTIHDDLLQMCRQLHTLMAANWTLFEGAGEFLPIGFDANQRDVIVQQVALKLAIDPKEAQQRVAAKEAQLTPNLATLETAHTCTNGKFLLNKMYEHYIAGVRRGLVKEHLFNLLVRAVKQQGVHADIRMIIEDRILK